MAERTEDEAVRQVLPITVAGEPVELRVLSMDESDAWVRQVAALSLGPVGPSGPTAASETDAVAGLLNAGPRRALELIRLYDVDGAIPPDKLARMTKGEVKAASDAMALAEDPFGSGLRRLAGRVLGAASDLVGETTRFLIAGKVGPGRPRQPAKRPNGASDAGASTGPVTSGPDGPGSDSSSSGSTVRRPRTPPSAPNATLSPTPSRSATPRP